MKRTMIFVMLIGVTAIWLVGCDMLLRGKPVVIVYPQKASIREILAAREVRRYVYQRTGTVLVMMEHGPELLDDKEVGDVIIVAQKDRPIVRELAEEHGLNTLLDLIDPEDFLLRTLEQKKRRLLLITGGDDVGTLYGAYRFAETLGVRFYLHGDVIPEMPVEFKFPDLNEDAHPHFATRGIQPFHDFPEGPDWWSLEDYRAVLSQLPKLRMNFFGLHCYPEGGVGPEPSVWIGLADEFNADGTVRTSYPSRWFTTHEAEKFDYSWGYAAQNTGDYVFGSAMLFDRDVYGPDVMRGYGPLPETPEGSNEVFNRAGDLLGDVFSYADMLGIKTCIGTETPLTIPKHVQDRLKKRGKNPSDQAVVQELYEGMFSRIMKTGSPDYYWFWTPEGWIWGGNTAADVAAAKDDLLAAVNAAEQAGVPFTLATCGWVLGPQSDRALFDTILPETMPMSCINRFLGMAPVDVAFNSISNRSKWAIPWLEDDPALTLPQLWAGRMRADAVDALKYGCTGLIGIHWRTRILGPNVSALARAAWNQRAFVHKPPPEGPIGENVREFTSRFHPADQEIEGTDDDPLYRTVRSELSGYRLNVPNGTYVVTLKFCETYHDNAGYRVFDINIQDEPAATGMDIFTEAGKNTAYDRVFEDVTVSNGVLDIKFIRRADYPVLSALTVEKEGFSLKINCGGPEYQDYRADWKTAQPRDLATADFYDDWAATQFGIEAADRISQLFQRIDGRLPRPAAWVNGPGGFAPDTRAWDEVSGEYAFVGELESIRPLVRGAGNLERFDYWLNSFRYLMMTSHLRCAWGRFNEAMEKVNAEQNSSSRAQLARETALPRYRALVELTGEAVTHLLATVSTNGELGTVTNINSHLLPSMLGETGKKLAEALGEELPADAVPSREYSGNPRIIVPTLESALVAGEPLTLKVIILDRTMPERAKLSWRTIGEEAFTNVPLEHIARGVYTVTVLPDGIPDDGIEYFLAAVTASGDTLHFPATAPHLNQTVVAIPSE